MALKKTALGAATLSIARVLQMASSFIAVPFLARILTPTDFGLVALALSVVTFFTYIGDAGFGRSLVRTSAADAESWSSAHWAVISLTVCLALAIVVLAWPASIFFREPRLMPILAVFALAPIMIGLTEIPASSLLQQEKFQWLAASEFISAIAGVGVAISLAVAGAGAWALVWQQLTQRIVKGLVINFAARFRPRLVLRPSLLGEHLRFAVDTVGWSIMTFVGRQADTLIVGKFLGAATLGLYNVAIRVMQLPVSIFGGSLNSVLYPRMARLHGDPAALRQMVLTVSLAQAAFVFPPIAAIAAAGKAFFLVLLSDRWHGVGDIFTLLAVAGAVQTVVGLNGSLLQAIGQTGARLRLTVEFAIFWSVSALILAQFNIEAVALGSSVVTLLYLPRLLHLYLGPIQCSSLDYARQLAGPTLVAVALFVGHRILIANYQINAWPQIGLAVLETVLGWGLLLVFGRHTISAQMKTMREIFAG
ncbi:MAG: lipopolysaccharide biosynthesis protein [Proteobacteria bacterium]|nr:lipopolysaccharide biosynthesis protein [Pseudomonadota bacterium]